MGVKAITLFLFVLGFQPFLSGQESCLSVDSSEALKPVFTFNLSCYKPEQSLELEDPSGLLALYLVKDGKLAPVPVTSSCTLLNDRVQLIPKFNLGEGLEFSLRGTLISGSAGLFTYKTPSLALPVLEEPKVVKIFPEERVVPENILCFHVLFNQPMSRQRDAYGYVKVYHEGEEIPTIWKHTSTWAENGKLLVLMIHPGRVKRGIAHPGEILSKGKTFKMVIGVEIKDAYGRSLLQEATKEFEIGEADYKVPKMKKRDMELPEERDLSPITLKFSEPMDYARMVEGTQLLNKDGAEVEHRVECVNDNLFRFYPQENWESGQHELVLTRLVADLSGNQLDRKFEVKTKPSEEDLLEKRVIKFTIP